MLKDICKKYDNIRPKLVVLFGSRARGDYIEESDYDLLVVSDFLPRDPRRAFEILYDPSNPLISPIGMNTKVFLRKLDEASPFILEVIEDGKILCGDKDFIELVFRLYKDKRRMFKRFGKTWIIEKK